MRVNEWTVANIAVWNKIKFPDNTEWKQYRKVKEEVREYKDAVNKNDRLSELADVYIALAGLSRFSPLGGFVCNVFEQLEGFEKLKKAVDAKMLKNIRRTFDKGMHHVGKDD